MRWSFQRVWTKASIGLGPLSGLPTFESLPGGTSCYLVGRRFIKTRRCEQPLNCTPARSPSLLHLVTPPLRDAHPLQMIAEHTRRRAQSRGSPRVAQGIGVLRREPLTSMDGAYD